MVALPVGVQGRAKRARRARGVGQLAIVEAGSTEDIDALTQASGADVVIRLEPANTGRLDGARHGPRQESPGGMLQSSREERVVFLDADASNDAILEGMKQVVWESL